LSLMLLMGQTRISVFKRKNKKIYVTILLFQKKQTKIFLTTSQLSALQNI